MRSRDRNTILKAHAQSLQSYPVLVTPWTVTCPAPLSMEFSGQEHWSGFPFPSPTILKSFLKFLRTIVCFSCACCCSVAESCLTVCNPMDCSTPGLPVPHHRLKFAQAHFHWINDTIQPSHSLLPTSPSAFNLFQHQGLFQPSGQSIGASASASVLLMSSQGWFPLWWTGLISFLSKGLKILL